MKPCHRKEENYFQASKREKKESRHDHSVNFSISGFKKTYEHLICYVCNGIFMMIF